MSKKTKQPAAKSQAQVEKESMMALEPRNYKLMLIGLAVIVLGLVLMAGGSSESPDVFNYEMFSFRRITLAPILVLGGFAFEVYAIMSKGKKSKEQ